MKKIAGKKFDPPPRTYDYDSQLCRGGVGAGGAGLGKCLDFAFVGNIPFFVYQHTVKNNRSI